MKGRHLMGLRNLHSHLRISNCLGMVWCCSWYQHDWTQEVKRSYPRSIIIVFKKDPPERHSLKRSIQTQPDQMSKHSWHFLNDRYDLKEFEKHPCYCLDYLLSYGFRAKCSHPRWDQALVDFMRGQCAQLTYGRCCWMYHTAAKDSSLEGESCSNASLILPDCFCEVYYYGLSSNTHC